jgi:DNA-binding response OmpR family regulator
VLVVDADAALLDLLEDWLRPHGCIVVHERTGEGAMSDDITLVIVDLPLARPAGPDVLTRIAGAYPGTPVLALAANLFPTVKSDGPVARALGVAGVLPKPVARDALVRTVRTLLNGSDER